MRSTGFTALEKFTRSGNTFPEVQFVLVSTARNIPSVNLFPRNHPPHAPERVFLIAVITGDQVEVNMKNGLPGSRTHIDPHMETTGMKPVYEDGFTLVNHQP